MYSLQYINEKKNLNPYEWPASEFSLQYHP